MNNKSFNLNELLGISFLSVLLLSLILPMSDASARTSRLMQNTTQLRGIHQGLVTYANSNKNWYPGLNSKGEDAGVTIEERMQAILQEYLCTPEYIVSPLEDDPSIHEWPGTGPVTSSHYSFALLQLPASGERRNEWSPTLNSQAIVIADRNSGTPISTYGYHNKRWTSSTTFGCTHNRRQPYANLNHWVGNVLWNDNHNGLETADTLATQYGGVVNPQDQLFSAAGDDDALLIHAGN